jgi:hypothetical protein
VTTLAELVADPCFPFEGDVRVKALQPRQVPEPDRDTLTKADCGVCARDDSHDVWTDAHWRLRGYGEPCPFAGVVLLEPRGHYDSYPDLPTDLAELGPLTARVERALLTLRDVARGHVARWGPGSAHLHQWFFPRPLGQLQLRGSMLPVWMDVLPAQPDSAEAAALTRVGAAMAAGDRARD